MKTMCKAKVSIIMLNWNGVADTSENLESLQKLTYPNFDVTVVDNGSVGRDVEILRERFGNFTRIIVNDRNYGISQGNNVGISHVLAQNPEYILLLNNDLIVAPDFLDELMSVATAEPNMGIASPTIYYYHERSLVQYGGETTRWLGLRASRQWGAKQDESPKESYFISAAAMLFRTDKLLSMGIMGSTNGYFIFADDIMYSMVALKAGHKLIYVPRSKVWHKGSRSLKRIGGVRARWVMKDHIILRYRFLTQGFFSRMPRKYFVYYFMWFFFYRPWDVFDFLKQNWNTKTFANLFSGAWEGVRFIGTGRGNREC